MTIQNIITDLYKETTNQILYHYTSLGNVINIISNKSLWATAIRYFNDAAEMQHTANLLTNEIDKRLYEGSSHVKMLTQFRKWLSHRITKGHMLYVVSFTTNGNLLSQWRAYCQTAKGVSLGFLPEKLDSCSKNQQFRLAKCIYDPHQQRRLIETILNEIESLAITKGENQRERHPSESYYGIFEEVEPDVLGIAALLKYPAFSEEEEWRAISNIIVNYAASSIKYREGLSSLIPYLEFNLPAAVDRQVDIECIYLGPTPNVNNSMNSLSNYLAKQNCSPRNGIYNSNIPYRAW